MQFLSIFVAVWYFVLTGSTKERVETIFRLYPEALMIPLTKEDTGAGTEKFSLLEAACRSSQTSDEVLIFLAQNCPPEALSESFYFEPWPFVSRVIRGPTSGNAPLASLELVQTLAPLDIWRSYWFCELFNLGYGADILLFAADRSCKSTEQQ